MKKIAIELISCVKIVKESLLFLSFILRQDGKDPEKLMKSISLVPQLKDNKI